MTDFNELAHWAAQLCARISDPRGEQPPGSDDFNTLALQLFRRQVSLIPLYAEFCRVQGRLPPQVTEWREIPAIPTTAFKEFRLSSIPDGQIIKVFHSSGTSQTQRPSCHSHCPESLRLYEASLQAWFKSYLVPARPMRKDSQPHSYHLLALTPPPEQAPHSSLVHMFDTVGGSTLFAQSTFLAANGPDGAWQVDIRQAREALSACIEKNVPLVLAGPAFAFVHLLDHMAADGHRIQLPPGSQVMETGGYKGRSRAVPRAEFHWHLQYRLGLAPPNIVSEYGMSELSSQAYAVQPTTACHNQPSNVSGIFQFPPWARARVISPETGLEAEEGEQGLLQVYDLANAFSLMAVQTQDMAIRLGLGFELLGRADHVEPRGCSLMLS